MGSRAVVIVYRDENVAAKRFGIVGEGIGICYTRRGRRFFDDAQLEAQLLNIVREALEASKLWDELNTDWMCLDCELMPWSAKAQELHHYMHSALQHLESLQRLCSCRYGHHRIRKTQD